MADKGEDPWLGKNYSLAGVIFMLLFAGAAYVAVMAGVLLFFYGIVVIVFRAAFGVHLPNPFNWL